MADQNWYFVIAAYGVAWAFLIGYAVYVHRTLRRARERWERATVAGARGEE